MSRPSRSSLSASTPDSLSDNESSMGPASAAAGRYAPRKPSYTPNRTGLTPGGSRNGSKPNSRPASRTGSKPPSRHGSNLSLDSTGIFAGRWNVSMIPVWPYWFRYCFCFRQSRWYNAISNSTTTTYKHIDTVRFGAASITSVGWF